MAATLQKSSPVMVKRGRPPKDDRDTGPRRIIMQVSPAYDEWLDKMAIRLRTTKAGAMDRMMAEWAATNGVEPPPQRL